MLLVSTSPGAIRPSAIRLGTLGSIDRATSTSVGVPGGGGGGEKPGLLRRGLNAVKSALGLGGADTSGGRTKGGGNAERARESYTFWRGKGLTHEQAAGLVGMEQGESNFNPKSRGDGGLAHGAFQHHPDRRAAILRGTGIDISNSTHLQQLEATHWEMTQGGERGFWNKIKQAKTAGEAAAIGVYQFERPKDKAGEAVLRGQYANNWAQRFAGSPVVQPQPKTAAPSAPPINFPTFGKGVGGFDVNALGAAPALGGNSTTNSNTVTMNHNTTVKIDAGGDPATAGSQVERAVNRSNDLSLRNAQTAIR